MKSKDGTDETEDTDGEESDGLTVWGLLWRLALFALIGGTIVCGIAYGTAAPLSWGVPHSEALMSWMGENPRQAKGIGAFLFVVVTYAFMQFHDDNKW